MSDKKSKTILITEVSEHEGKIACANTYNQMDECRTSIHMTLEDLFFQDHSSLQSQEEDDTVQFALIMEVIVEDRTNNKALFEFANVKGEDGRGIMTVCINHNPSTLRTSEKRKIKHKTQRNLSMHKLSRVKDSV